MLNLPIHHNEHFVTLFIIFVRVTLSFCGNIVVSRSCVENSPSWCINGNIWNLRHGCWISKLLRQCNLCLCVLSTRFSDTRAYQLNAFWQLKNQLLDVGASLKHTKESFCSGVCSQLQHSNNRFNVMDYLLQTSNNSLQVDFHSVPKRLQTRRGLWS